MSYFIHVVLVSESHSINELGFFFQSENEICEYLDQNPKIDYVCEMFGIMVGVSVTRAMKFCYPNDYRGNLTEKDARKLIERKLKGKIL